MNGVDYENDPGSNTVLRMGYKIMSEKLRYKRTNQDIDRECMRHAYGGHGQTQHPQSYAALRAAFDVRNADEHEAHVCAWCGRVFPHLHRNAWHQHRYQRCQHCGCDRFVVADDVSGPRPRKRAWLRPLNEVVRSFLRDERVVSCLGLDKTGPNAEKQWTSRYMTWLNDMCNDRLFHPPDDHVSMTFALGVSLDCESCLKITCGELYMKGTIGSLPVYVPIHR